MFTYWFSSPEKINDFIIFDHRPSKLFIQKDVLVPESLFYVPSQSSGCDLSWDFGSFGIICTWNCLFKITFFVSRKDGRGQIMKKGQAGSSIKILNKAKIILIITNGNVDFITSSPVFPCYDAVPCPWVRVGILFNHGEQQSADFGSVQVK